MAAVLPGSDASSGASGQRGAGGSRVARLGSDRCAVPHTWSCAAEQVAAAAYGAARGGASRHELAAAVAAAVRTEAGAASLPSCPPGEVRAALVDTELQAQQLVEDVTGLVCPTGSVAYQRGRGILGAGAEPLRRITRRAGRAKHSRGVVPQPHEVTQSEEDLRTVKASLDEAITGPHLFDVFTDGASMSSAVDPAHSGASTLDHVSLRLGLVEARVSAIENVLGAAAGDGTSLGTAVAPCAASPLVAEKLTQSSLWSFGFVARRPGEVSGPLSAVSTAASEPADHRDASDREGVDLPARADLAAAECGEEAAGMLIHISDSCNGDTATPTVDIDTSSNISVHVVPTESTETADCSAVDEFTVVGKRRRARAKKRAMTAAAAAACTSPAVAATAGERPQCGHAGAAPGCRDDDQASPEAPFDGRGCSQPVPVAAYRSRCERLCQQYLPSMLPNLDGLFQHCRGHESEIYLNFCERFHLTPMSDDEIGEQLRSGLAPAATAAERLAPAGAYAATSGRSDVHMREARIRDIFRFCDKDCNEFLNSHELRTFACLENFTCSDDDWNREYHAICVKQGFGYFRGLDIVHFTSLLNEEGDSGLYCSDERLLALHRKILHGDEGGAPPLASGPRRAVPPVR